MTAEQQAKKYRPLSYPVDVNWDTPVPQTTMGEMFDQAVARYAGRDCLNFMGRKYSFAEVGRLVDRMTRAFQDQGVKKGTKIGLCLPNTPFYVISYFAAMKAGATVVNFNPLYAEQEMEHLINDSGAEIMVTVNIPGIQDKVEKMLGGRTGLKKIVSCDMGDGLSAVKGAAYKAINAFKRLFKKPDATIKTRRDDTHVLFRDMIRASRKPKKVEVSPDDIALFQYTGGTTALPKGAMLTHGNITANLAQANMWFATASANLKKEKTLAILPFFHVFSMTLQMCFSINRGGELLLLPKRFDLIETLKTIDREKPTMIAGVPAQYKAICDHKNVKDYDLSSLVICLSGGAALPRPTAEAFKALTGVDIIEGYGLSETAPLAMANPMTGEKKPGAVGLPMPGTEARIADIEFPDKDVPINVTGEICLRGPQVMKGYNNRPDDKSIDKDGFFHTGDLGHMDADGHVFIGGGRLKEMVVLPSGMKVFPLRLEAAILQHPDVSEVIVAGWKDDPSTTDERVRAFIVLKEGAKQMSRAEWKTFLADKVAPYEVPSEFGYRTELPKTMIGKPDKKALLAAEYAAAEAARQKPAAPRPPSA